LSHQTFANALILMNEWREGDIKDDRRHFSPMNVRSWTI